MLVIAITTSGAKTSPSVLVDPYFTNMKQVAHAIIINSINPIDAILQVLLPQCQEGSTLLEGKISAFMMAQHSLLH